MVCLVRSEDRRPSKRVFPLLQNLDLDTVTFAQVQSTGEPISIEDMNEQEMVDLIIVNLARLAVKQEWTGLLEAGGGAGLVEVLPLTGTTNADQYDVSSTPPWNGATITNQDLAGVKKPHAFPFIAPETGDLSAIGIQVTAAAAGDSLYVAIYSQDTNFLPSTLLGYATISVAVTGEIYQTSLSATVSLTAGSQYFYSVSLDQASNADIRALHLNDTPALGITTALNTKAYSIEDTTRDNYAVPPSTFTPATINGDEPRYVIGLKF
jgi:hypothetical protein